MPPSLRLPARPRTKEQQRSGDASDQERQSVALWHEGSTLVSRCQERPGPTTSVTTAANEMTNQLGNCKVWREQFVPSRCRLPRALQREELAEVDGLADRRAPRQGKNLGNSIHASRNKTAIKYRIHESQHPGQGRSTHFCIIKRQFGSESQIQGLLKTITNWRCYSRWPTCFGRTK